jgi:arylsulfatase A-like enzyme/thioredoxin-like negative regulator of GroEL
VKRALVLAVLAVAACRQAAPPAASAPPNILLITIDTWRADRVGRGLMPAVDGLAATGVRFTHARSTVPLTLPSHTSIMTGTLPPANGVRMNGVVASGTPTIARVLHDGGYQTGAFIGAYVLDRRFGLADGFDMYDDRVLRDPSGNQQLEAQRRGDAVVDVALRWLSKSATGPAKPFFAWVHLYDPHAPYEPPPEYLEKAGRNAYDGEVAFADAQVGRLLDWLASSGHAGNTVVAIAGDHGEGLGEHGELTHGMLAYDSTLRVPLVIAVPGRPAASDDRPVSLVELAGTLVQLAGRALPTGMHAGTLLSRTEDRGPRTEDRGPGTDEAYAETQYPKTAGWHSLAALADDRWKLIQSSETELYDIVQDPGERTNLADAKGSLADAMRQRVATLASARPANPSDAVPADAAERLRALGYVSGSSASAPDAESAPNPADHIAAWNTFEKGLSRLTGGDARGALPDLAGLARAFPDAPVFLATYARALKDTGRTRDAVEVYRRAVARWPRDAGMYHDLAVAAEAAGLPAESARAEQAALALEPSNPAAANGLGLLQIRASKPDDAIKSFEQAVKGDPTNATYWTNLGNARRDTGNAAGAEDAYRKALDADPRSPDAANGLGVLLVQAHRAAEAIPWFERALAGSPRFIEAVLNLGIAYQETGNATKAADQYRRVLEMAPHGSREYQAATALLKAEAR